MTKLKSEKIEIDTFLLIGSATHTPLVRRELEKLGSLVAQKGYSLIPLSLYFKDSKVKMQIGLCKGKKLYDKRADMAERDARRDVQRTLKEREKVG